MLRNRMGRLLIVAGGGGCLAVLIFVVSPMLNGRAQRMTPDEIVPEVQESYDRDDGSEEEIAGADDVMRRPSSPVGVWNDGREGMVVFRAAESETEAVGLPQILSEQDVAEARAVLEGEEPEPAVAVEPDSAGESERDAAPVVEPPEAVPPASGEEMMTALVASPAVEAPIPAAEAAGETNMNDATESEASLHVVPAPDTGANVEQLEAMVRELVRAMRSEREGTGIEGRMRSVERQEIRRSEFDAPVSLNSRAPLEVSHPSGGVPAIAATEAAQAGKAQSGLPPRTGVIVPGTSRGVMGYRLPLVSRQEVPDQIVSGVLLPAHTTFVIVKQGAWELIDLTAEEVQALREAAARKEREAAAAEADAGGAGRPWTLWRALRGRTSPPSE